MKSRNFRTWCARTKRMKIRTWCARTKRMKIGRLLRTRATCFKLEMNLTTRRRESFGKDYNTLHIYIWKKWSEIAFGWSVFSRGCHSTCYWLNKPSFKPSTCRYTMVTMKSRSSVETPASKIGLFWFHWVFSPWECSSSSYLLCSDLQLT